MSGIRIMTSVHHITADHILVGRPHDDGSIAVLVETAAAQLHFTSLDELDAAAARIRREVDRIRRESALVATESTVPA